MRWLRRSISSGSSAYSRSISCSITSASPSTQPTPTRNATVPAPPDRPVVSVSRNRQRRISNRGPHQPIRRRPVEGSSSNAGSRDSRLTWQIRPPLRGVAATGADVRIMFSLARNPDTMPQSPPTIVNTPARIVKKRNVCYYNKRGAVAVASLHTPTRLQLSIDAVQPLRPCLRLGRRGCE